jgi:hypothetical protein
LYIHYVRSATQFDALKKSANTPCLNNRPSVQGQAADFAPRPLRAQAVWKHKSSKRDENEILKIDLKAETACGVGIESSAAQMTFSIAV